MIDLPPHQPVPHRPWWAPFASVLLILSGGCGITLMIGLNIFLVGAFLEWLWFEPTDGEMVTFGLVLAAYFATYGLYFGRSTAITMSWCGALFLFAGLLGGVLTMRFVDVLLALVGLALAQLATLGFIGCLRKGARLSDDRFWHAVHRAAQACPFCLYSTRGLNTGRCPECGMEFNSPLSPKEK